MPALFDQAMSVRRRRWPRRRCVAPSRDLRRCIEIAAIGEIGNGDGGALAANAAPMAAADSRCAPYEGRPCRPARKSRSTRFATCGANPLVRPWIGQRSGVGDDGRNESRAQTPVWRHLCGPAATAITVGIARSVRLRRRRSVARPSGHPEHRRRPVAARRPSAHHSGALQFVASVGGQGLILTAGPCADRHDRGR